MVLVLLMDTAGFRSAGLANALAACFGISTAFLGNKYLVFESAKGGVCRQGFRFGLLYASMACLHGGILLIWSDIGKLDYRAGFIMATGMQVIINYWGSKLLVFKP